MSQQPSPVEPRPAALDPFGAWPLLRQASGPWPISDALIPEGRLPRADIEETGDAFFIEIELPGVAKRDVSIEQSGRRLNIAGERKERERTGVLRHRTRLVGTFNYEVILPGEVREDGVDATLVDGVLTIRVPKREPGEARRVPIA